MIRRGLTWCCLLVTLVLATNTFVAIGWLQPIVVAGDSMAPTFVDGQRLFIKRNVTPQRWDTVVVRSPMDAERLVVKRVVGLPGEEVCLRGGQVWADGVARNQPAGRNVYYGAMGNPTWRLGSDEWLVVGDNQLVSIDSRNWRLAPGIPGRLIVGVVVE